VITFIVMYYKLLICFMLLCSVFCYVVVIGILLSIDGSLTVEKEEECSS
jgi:hypothetical protein